MCTAKKVVSLELDNGTLEKEFLEDLHYFIAILVNGTNVGYIDGYAANGYIHIELLQVDEKYRGKGYGGIALKKLKKIGKSLGIKAIDGECQDKRKNFYKRLGAKFECREEIDNNYILNKFYIDL